MYEHPYVYRQLTLTTSATGSQTQQNTFRIFGNQILFSLGIPLVELWCGKLIEELQVPTDLDFAATPGKAWCTAERIVDNELEFEAVKRYSDAVQLWLRCYFDHTDMSLDNESFQQAVFDGVVNPLETTLQQLTGSGLYTIT